MAQRRLPSTLAIVAGSFLADQVKNLGQDFVRRGRKRVADYILGKPYYRNSYSRSKRSNSLMRLTSVRRQRTKRRLSRGPYRRQHIRRRRTYKRKDSGNARRAMGTNGPAFRSRMKKSKYRVMLGNRIGHAPSRRTTFKGVKNDLQDKTLATSRLVAIEYSDTDTRMECRKGKLCDVIGVKFRAWISLKQNFPNNNVIWKNPLQIRWAIINPKDNTGAGTDIENGTNFFVSDDPVADDATDFPATGNCFRYMNHKINTRKYGILQEETFILSNDPASTESRVTSSSKKFISFYVPINRQMKWDSIETADKFPNANVHFVWWYVSLGDKDDAKKFDVSQPLDFHNERMTYFRNAEILN